MCSRQERQAVVDITLVAGLLDAAQHDTPIGCTHQSYGILIICAHAMIRQAV